MSEKYVYLFSEGNGKMRELLGGKGQICRNDQFGHAGSAGLYRYDGSLHTLLEDGEKIAPEITEEINRNLKNAGRNDEARRWVIRKTRCWFPFVRAPALPCRA